MENTMAMKGLFCRKKAEQRHQRTAVSSRADGKLSILDAAIGQTYTVKGIDTADEEMNAFLFRLGCYSGEPITLISKKKRSCIVAIKGSRYGLDNRLAEAVII